MASGERGNLATDHSPLAQRGTRNVERGTPFSANEQRPYPLAPWPELKYTELIAGNFDWREARFVMQQGRQSRTLARWSWLWAVLLLVMNCAQAVHVCELGEQFRAHAGAVVQGKAEAPHIFCTICASAHSPSLAASLVTLPPMDGPVEPSILRPVIRRSASPVVAFRIRPPQSPPKTLAVLIFSGVLDTGAFG